jgi:membrane associated rhomboid family serine protease
MGSLDPGSGLSYEWYECRLCFFFRSEEGFLLTESCTTAYRVNTFPFIHLNFIHALVNILALTPLMERFESEHGTLTSVAMFFGRKK